MHVAESMARPPLPLSLFMYPSALSAPLAKIRGLGKRRGGGGFIRTLVHEELRRRGAKHPSSYIATNEMRIRIPWGGTKRVNPDTGAIEWPGRNW